MRNPGKPSTWTGKAQDVLATLGVQITRRNTRLVALELASAALDGKAHLITEMRRGLKRSRRPTK